MNLIKMDDNNGVMLFPGYVPISYPLGNWRHAGTAAAQRRWEICAVLLCTV